jgi:hypothetical protein
MMMVVGREGDSIRPPMASSAFRLLGLSLQIMHHPSTTTATSGVVMAAATSVTGRRR